MTAIPASAAPRGAAPTASDPAIEAAALLHQAARLPYEAASAPRWTQQFQRLIAAAADRLREHRWLATSPGAGLDALCAERPRLRHAALRQSSEHDHLSACVASLLRAAFDGPVDALRAVELMEGALEIERELRRHHAHLIDLVYEATNREIGGPARRRRGARPIRGGAASESRERPSRRSAPDRVASRA